MDMNFEFPELKLCLNDFNFKNQLLIEKCEQINRNLRAMKTSCFIAKNVCNSVMKTGAAISMPSLKGGVSLPITALCGAASALGTATHYGTEFTEVLILRVFCAELRYFGQQRDDIEQECSTLLAKFVSQNQGPLNDLYFFGVTPNGVPLKAMDVARRVNNWNENPSVEDITQLIKDLEKDRDMIRQIEESFNEFSTALMAASYRAVCSRSLGSGYFPNKQNFYKK